MPDPLTTNTKCGLDSGSSLTPEAIDVFRCAQDLHLAVYQDEAEEVKSLCISSSDPRGFAFLSMIGATVYEQVDIVRLLVKEFALPTNSRDIQKEFAHKVGILHWAAASGSDGVVKLLVSEFQVDVDEVYPPSSPAQIYSEMHSSFEIRQVSNLNKPVSLPLLDILGEICGDIGRPFEILMESCNEASSALFVATIEGHLSTVELLISLGAEVDAPGGADAETPLERAIQDGRTDMVQLLLQYGAQVSTGPAWRKPPICRAAECGYDEIIQTLVEHGFNLFLSDSDGFQPIHAACFHGHKSSVRALVDLGASINSCTLQDGWSCASVLFCDSAHAEAGTIIDSMLPLLFELGADFDQADKLGLTPLHLAADDNLLSTVRLLCELGANVDAECNDGYTPLLVAAQHGHDAIIDLLASDFGARIDAVGKDGRTAAAVAAINGHATTIQLLAELGADFETMTPDGFSIIHFASIGGFETITSYLDEVRGMQDIARLGTVATIQDYIVSGLPVITPVQWLKLLPDRSRKDLAAWVSSSLKDSKACYSAMFHPLVDQTSFSFRTKIAHDGHSHIKKSIISFLVYKSSEARRALRLLDSSLESLEYIIGAMERAERDLKKAQQDVQQAQARMGRWAVASHRASRSIHNTPQWALNPFT